MYPLFTSPVFCLSLYAGMNQESMERTRFTPSCTESLSQKLGHCPAFLSLSVQTVLHRDASSSHTWGRGILCYVEIDTSLSSLSPLLILQAFSEEGFGTAAHRLLQHSSDPLTPSSGVPMFGSCHRPSYGHKSQQLHEPAQCSVVHVQQTAESCRRGERPSWAGPAGQTCCPSWQLLGGWVSKSPALAENTGTGLSATPR